MVVETSDFILKGRLARRNGGALKYSFHGNPYCAHAKIIDMVGRDKEVLEVGCASGYLSERFSSNGCKVVGIEIDPQAAEMAKEHCSHVIIGDVENRSGLPQESETFDVIVLSDVLEHLKDPKGVLMSLKKHLKEDGYLVLSIPNVANWRVRLGLLFGIFSYAHEGILDEDHLRFFTLATSRKLIESSGFKIMKMDITPGAPLDCMGELGYLIAKSWKGLFAFQFLFEAKKVREIVPS